MQYMDAVRSGEIPVCKYVKQAVERQRRDLKAWGTKGPYEFDQEEAGEWCEFIEELPHIKGPLAGQNIRLEPWQCFILTTVFGWKKRATGTRRFRRVYIEVPRGNAKSTLSSGVGLKAAFADGEGGAEVYSAATTRDQARIVFKDAQGMARRRAELCRELGVEVLAHDIVQSSTASKFTALASDSNSLDGLNIHFAAVDELHAHKTREVYDVLETGTGKRPQSMLWSITTAGSDRAGICYELRTYTTKVLGRVIDDESLFGLVYTIDDDDDWTDEASWRKANPNWGVSVQPDVVAQLAAKAMQMPAAQANFKTKHLDVWVNADQAWMDMRAWDRCADPDLTIDQFAGEQCYIGLDLASKTDIAARIAIFPKVIDGQTHYYLFGRYFLPEQAIEDGRNSQYRGWQVQGLLTATPGDVLDFQAVEDDVMALSTAHQVAEVAYDPWQATQLAQRLQTNGATTVEYRNTVGNFSAPMKELDALARSGRLHHTGDPVLTWMVSNVVCHTDAKENIYPRKERPENKIDGVIATITGLGRAMVSQSTASFWE
jgi:phage terminase large subunit-like protein